MDNTQPDTEIDLNTYISISEYGADFFNRADQIDSQITKMVESELSGYSSLKLFLVGRKSRALYDPFLTTLINNNKRFGLSACTLFSHTESSLVITYSEQITKKCQRKIRKHNYYAKRICILTDAINTGTEIERVIQVVNPKSIEKICGYLALSPTIATLKTKYPSIQFSFVRMVDNMQDYLAEQNNLHFIYQGRLVPLEDNDHPYCRYSLKYQISPDETRKILTDILKPYLIDEISQEICKYPGVEMYAASLDPEQILKLFPQYHHTSYEFERISIKFKIIIPESKIIVTAVPSVDLQQKISYRNCEFNLKLPLCPLIHLPEDTANKPVDVICPYCIDQNISRDILQHIDNELKRRLKERNIAIEVDVPLYNF